MTPNDLTKLFWNIKNVIDNNQMQTQEHHTLVRALHAVHAIAERERARLEAVFFVTCHKCCTEIDRRKEKPTPIGAGFYVHSSCPVLKPDNERR